MRKQDDDAWPDEVEIDDAAFEQVSESGDAQTLLGTGTPLEEGETIRLTESDGQ